MQTVVSPRPDPGKRKFPLWKVWACYITALLFTGLILATIIGAVSSLLPDSWKDTVSAWSLLEYTGLAFLIIYFTKMIGDIWRSRAEDLKLGFTDLPNPFYIVPIPKIIVAKKHKKANPPLHRFKLENDRGLCGLLPFFYHNVIS